MSDTTSAPTQSDAQRFVPGGPPAAEEPGMQDGDFGVGPDAGDLKTQLLTALESRWNADDPGATTLDDDATTTPPSADTAATPAPAPTPDTTAVPSQGADDGQDGAGGGRAADDAQGGAATPAPADDAAAPGAPDDFDLNAYARDYFGTDLNRDQSQRLFSMLSRLQSLTPQEQEWIDGVLAGNAPNQYPGTMGQPVQQPPMQPVAPQTAAPDPAVDVLGPRPDQDEYAAQQWDLSARAVRYQAEQTEAIRADIARTTEFQLQQQRAQAEARVNAALDQWRKSYPVLTDGEFDGLVQRAAQTQQLPGLIAHFNQDIERATTSLLEQHFWADPQLRERAIANVASGRAAGDSTTVDPASPVAQQQATADQGRQQLAASVAGGGGSVPPQTTAVPKDPEARKAAMAAEIAAMHDFT